MKKVERYSVQKVTGDGRCLFRALVSPIYSSFPFFFKFLQIGLANERQTWYLELQHDFNQPLQHVFVA